MHAILDGIIIYEIQQNSDTTYRVFDWNRVDKNGVPRELHIDKALDVINFNFNPEVIGSNSEIGENKLISNNYFTTYKVCINDSYISKSDKDTFFGFTIIKGNGKLEANNIEYDLVAGQTFIIPATLGEFEIVGADMELIKTSM